MTVSPLEKALAASFDSLVDSWQTASTFANQATRVAEFIRLYVQNLFLLDKDGFIEVVKQHNNLHTRAAGYERRGKNPLELLRQQMQQFDDLGRILRRYAQHLGAIDCMLDVRATTALAHHMLSLQPAADLPENVVACEFGAGLGILSISGTIPLLRAGHHVTLHAFEQAAESRKDAEKIAAIIKRSSRYADRLDFYFHQGDITTEAPYLMVCAAETTAGPVALWISETFGYQSKQPIVDEGSVHITYGEPSGIPAYSDDLEKIYDPLPLVLDLSCRHFSTFIAKIRDGKIIAFPDIVTPKVIINGSKSAILSPDGTWRPLYELGLPYTMLPLSGQSRWHLASQTASAKKQRACPLSTKKIHKPRK